MGKCTVKGWTGRLSNRNTLGRDRQKTEGRRRPRSGSIYRLAEVGNDQQHEGYDGSAPVAVHKSW